MSRAWPDRLADHRPGGELLGAPSRLQDALARLKAQALGLAILRGGGRNTIRPVGRRRCKQRPSSRLFGAGIDLSVEHGDCL